VASSPITVDALSRSTGAPQDEQNRPFGGSCAPQEVQNMGARILPPSSRLKNTTGNDRTSCVQLATRAYADREALRSMLGVALYLHGSAVCQHLRNALHDLGRVIAHRYHRIRAVLRRVLKHQLERILPGLLAQIGEDGDVAADDRLQRRSQISNDA